MAYLTHRPIAVERLVAEVSDPACGGVVTFVGVVRNHHEGRRVTRLEYSAYEPMAEREMEAVARAVGRRHKGVRLAMRHRLGALKIGDVAVAIAAASAHRSEAFDACQKAIDLVKTRVPVWKKEYGPKGMYWIEGTHCVPSRHGRGRKNS